jgi:hypothetical protein
MKFKVYETSYQLFVLPYIGVTYDKTLNGHYELFFGWLKYEAVITIK